MSNAFIPSQSEIGDPFEAMRRVQAFRERMRPPAKVNLFVRPPALPKKAKARVKKIPIVRDIIDVRSTFYDEIASQVEPENPEDQTRYDARERARTIIKEVATKFSIPWKWIISDRRTNIVVIPRHYAMWRVRNETILSHPDIGRIFRRDHTVSVYACQKIDKLIAERKFDAAAL